MLVLMKDLYLIASYIKFVNSLLPTVFPWKSILKRNCRLVVYDWLW